MNILVELESHISGVLQLAKSLHTQVACQSTNFSRRKKFLHISFEKPWRNSSPGKNNTAGWSVVLSFSEIPARSCFFLYFLRFKDSIPQKNSSFHFASAQIIYPAIIWWIFVTDGLQEAYPQP